MPPQEKQTTEKKSKSGPDVNVPPPSIHASSSAEREDDAKGQEKVISHDDLLNLQAETLILHPTISLPFLVMLDMLSVSLVVPLLNQYFIDSGVTNASQRELLSSLYSSSQIVGGFLIGGLLDTGILSRKHCLYLSFLGSSLSYALIVYGGMKGLIVSRIVVGLIKQTSTISTSMISTYSTQNDRSIHMGR